MLGEDRESTPMVPHASTTAASNNSLSTERKAHVSGMSSSGVSPSLPSVPKVPMHSQPWDLQSDTYHKYVCTF